MSDSSTTGGAQANTAVDSSTIVAAHQALGCDMLNQLSIMSPGQNIFISPLSVGTAFAMAYSGSRGKTASEMRKVLHLPAADLEAVNKAYSHYLVRFPAATVK